MLMQATDPSRPTCAMRERATGHSRRPLPAPTRISATSPPAALLVARQSSHGESRDCLRREPAVRLAVPGAHLDVFHEYCGRAADFPRSRGRPAVRGRRVLSRSERPGPDCGMATWRSSRAVGTADGQLTGMPERHFAGYRAPIAAIQACERSSASWCWFHERQQRAAKRYPLCLEKRTIRSIRFSSVSGRPGQEHHTLEIQRASVKRAAPNGACELVDVLWMKISLAAAGSGRRSAVHWRAF